MGLHLRKSFAVLMTAALLGLTACDGESQGGHGGEAQAPQYRPPAVQEQIVPTDKAALVAADGMPVETVVIAIESMIETRALSGYKADVESLGRALDQAFEIKCEDKCQIKEREN
jgi:hypothetical protein